MEEPELDLMTFSSCDRFPAGVSQSGPKELLLLVDG
jgi:hypothetical protein